MRNEFHAPLKKPRVAGHFPSLNKSTDINPNKRMFAEDVHVVMPLGGRSRQSTDFSVEARGILITYFVQLRFFIHSPAAVRIID